MFGILLAVLAIVFQLASIIPGSVLLILCAAVILIGVGSITGQ
jgi:hypothetical protein